MQTAKELAPAFRALVLRSDAAVLNVLVDLARADMAGYVLFLDWVDAERVRSGARPLREQKVDEFDKVEYMREFMGHKRARENRAVAIENMLRSERDAVKGTARLEFARRQSAKWKVRLDELIVRAREAHGVRLPAEATAALRKQFWASVDQELDAAEEAAKKKLRRG